MPFYVYVLKCCDGSYYTGHTDDLDNRMAQHGRGEGAKYTSKRRPLELVWVADFQTRSEAFELEQRLHGWSRAKKEALMRGDFDVLPGLSLNRAAREAQALALRQAQGERGGEQAESERDQDRAQGERGGDEAQRERGGDGRQGERGWEQARTGCGEDARRA